MRMFASLRGLVVCTLSMMLLALPVLAATAAEGSSDGKVSEALAANLYCSVYSIMGGNLGIILGLILVFFGLWGLIQGAKPFAVIPLIIIGSLMTALPSLIESGLESIATLLKEAGITDASTPVYTSQFKKLQCSGTNSALASKLPSIQEMEARYRNSLGEPYPSRGSYEKTNSFGGNDIDFSSGSI